MKSYVLDLDLHEVATNFSDGDPFLGEVLRM